MNRLLKTGDISHFSLKSYFCPDKNSGMSIIKAIRSATKSALKELYGIDCPEKDIQVNQTNQGFEGDYTVVLFAWVKQLKQSPDALGKALGERLMEQEPSLVAGFNIVKGFLNLSLPETWWTKFLHDSYSIADYGKAAASGRKVVVEYSSPNTNKPLHLGHLRNNFLGWSVAEILKANGHEVFKTSIVNDRGIHICKSMLAWQRFANGATPASTGIKGDHLVGDYYVQFENALKEETTPVLQQIMAGDLTAVQEADREKTGVFLTKLRAATLPPEKQEEIKAELKEIARNNTPIMREVRAMLLKWEEGDPATLDLWKNMNQWVYDGFAVTYNKIGSDFDKTYYESGTYLLGKQYVEEGLANGVFFRKPDGSVWIDLTAEGLDEKLVLRKDGTSVYITQDLGLANLKYEDYRMDESIYVIGDEQNYHMKVLKLICQKLNLPNSAGINHLSYGMVELPSGRMKSREGTVVDADDLVAEMEAVAARHTTELGKVKDFTPEELEDLYNLIGLGALKFFLLRVDPKKRMVFNPEESIDFHGFTGPFVQYTHARIKSILRKEQPTGSLYSGPLFPLEKELIVQLEQYSSIIEQAGQEMNPSLIANYVFHLAKTFNSFYAEHSIGNAENPEKKELRLQLALITATVIRSGMGLMGIRVPERM
ncbi:arginine--tRNA ligase [Parasegetibacter sp. NRK P23]|uniref:arginine--tRNA ligase n=1 Tax=Parasegetibacter sp. NRK P23 TaxID=2942999 RepID=UPI00204402D3|nr:arginine--tRNA ligase [Parasegetibacter sp. NRK P23]MCM5530059.1 arginine--tRNA ligase [Parasegetibacter sp. NRK P23]